MNYEPYESFKHGLTVSKLWLCETMEPHVLKPANVYILGAWTNVLAYMMLIRNKNLYRSIFAFDYDSEATDAANKICDTWKFEQPRVYNETKDVNTLIYKDCNLVINTSVEHMHSQEWFENIPIGTLVCLQSSDVTIPTSPWHIKNPILTQNELSAKYPLTKVLYLGTKNISYDYWGYKRFMLLGYK